MVETVIFGLLVLNLATIPPFFSCEFMIFESSRNRVAQICIYCIYHTNLYVKHRQICKAMTIFWRVYGSALRWTLFLAFPGLLTPTSVFGLFMQRKMSSIGPKAMCKRTGLEAGVAGKCA